MDKTQLLEKWGQPTQVLDHGFVRLVDVMGDDARIEQAARVSYQLGTRPVHETRGLIRSLMARGHTSPFEHCELAIHVKMPIFVARQWVRHRTAHLNEMSARYSALPHEYYVPPLERMQLQDDTDKQKSGERMAVDVAHTVRSFVSRGCDLGSDGYQKALNANLAREVARVCMPIAYYTQWHWKCDLHNVFHFLRLRLDSHAQPEIRVYAQVIADIVADWVPLAWEAFEDYKLHGMNLSRDEVECLGNFILGVGVLSSRYPDDLAELIRPCVKDYDGLTVREKRQLGAKLRRILGVES